MAEHTYPGGVVPAGSMAPGLLFHKLHAYDRFRGKLERKDAALPHLRAVVRAVQAENRQRYPAWHCRFNKACEALDAQTKTATTWWRMVVGWATNPALEIGIELDRLLGFPYVPGSAVKGLLHHTAEMTLTVPEVEPGAAAPPPSLLAATASALRIRALFGALTAQRKKIKKQDDSKPVLDDEDPPAPIERLERWRAHVEGLRDGDGQLPAPWHEVAVDLELLCAAAPTGGLVTCYDAVPAADTFGEGAPPVLEPDVLTPHDPGGGPNPIVFLAVPAGVRFELRYRLGALPASRAEEERSDQDRDPEETARRRALAGTTKAALWAQLETWLRQGLEEGGLGGKTAAGYGYLLRGARPALPDPPSKPKPPPPPPPPPPLPPAEQRALEILPEGLRPDVVGSRLDAELGKASAEVRSALAKRFELHYPRLLAKWRKRKKPVMERRIAALGLRDEDPPKGGES